MRVWIVPRSARVSIIAGETVSREVLCDIVISPLATEGLISDLLAGELEIDVEDFGRGLWRFRWESLDRLRVGEKKHCY